MHHSDNPGPDRTPSDRAAVLLGVIPERLGLGAGMFVAFFLPGAVSLAVLGLYRPLVVWPTIVLAALATVIVSRRLPVRPTSPLVSTVVLATAGFTALVGGWFANEHLFVHRDPGIYTLTAVRLADGEDLTIRFIEPATARTDLVDQASPGFSHDPAVVELDAFAQGLHGLPSATAPLVWLGGLRLLVRAPALLAAVGVLALFALVRRFASDRAAAVVTLAYAVSVPVVWAARTMYSETIGAPLLLVGLVLLVDGIRDHDRTWQVAVGAVVVAAGLTVRIDALVLLPAIVLVAALVRRRSPIVAGCSIVAAVAALVLWWLDLSLRSPEYLDSLRSSIRLLAALVVVGVIGVGVLEVVRHRWLARLGPPDDGLLDRWVRVATGVFGLVIVAFALRPVVLGQHEFDRVKDAVLNMERASGLEPVGIRSYYELAPSWHVQYLGWGVVGLGIVGLVVLGRRGVHRRDAGVLVLASLVVPLGLLYLWQASIFPDHPWALRRFLTSTWILLPVAVAVALDGAVERYGGDPRRRRELFAALSVPVVAFAAWPTRDAVDLVDHEHFIGLSEDLCAAVGDRPVLVQHSSVASFTSPPHLRIVCDVDVGVMRGASPEQVWRAVEWMRETTGERPLLVFDNEATLREAYEFHEVLTVLRIENPRDVVNDVTGISTAPSSYQLVISESRQP